MGAGGPRPAVALDAVRLVPARPTDFPDTPGFGFPVRFRIEASDDPTFAQRRRPSPTRRRRISPTPATTRVVFRPVGAKGPLCPRDGEAPVEAHRRLRLRPGGNGGRFRRQERGPRRRGDVARLHRGGPLEHSAISWTATTAARRCRTCPTRRRRRWCGGGPTLQEKIGQAEKDRKTAADALLDAATRDGLVRTAADLAAVDHDFQELASEQSGLRRRRRSRRGRSMSCTAATWSRSATAVTPGALSCVKELEADFNGLKENDEGGRRAALAGVDRRRPQPADVAFDRQPRLALPFRPRHRGHAQRLRPQRLAADASRTARLAGGRVPRRRRLVQEAAPPDRAERRLPPVVGRRRRRPRRSTPTTVTCGA